MRCIALDVHRDFCEVAIAEHGHVGHNGRIETSTPSLELFAASLASEDQLSLVVRVGRSWFQAIRRHTCRLATLHSIPFTSRPPPFP